MIALRPRRLRRSEVVRALVREHRVHVEQLVQPLFVGKRLDVNPLVIFLAVWFGSWLWGIVGIVLAVPCLVALKATAEHLSSARSLVDILDANRTAP